MLQNIDEDEESDEDESFQDYGEDESSSES